MVEVPVAIGLVVRAVGSKVHVELAANDIAGFDLAQIRLVRADRRHIVHDIHVDFHGVGVALRVLDGHREAVGVIGRVRTLHSFVRDGAGERVLDFAVHDFGRAQLAIALDTHHGVAVRGLPGHRLRGVRRVPEALFVDRHLARELGRIGLGDIHRHRGSCRVAVRVRYQHVQLEVRDVLIGLGLEAVTTVGR